MPTKKKTDTVSTDVPIGSAVEPKKSLAAIKSFRKTEPATAAPVAVKVKTKAEKISAPKVTDRKDMTGTMIWIVGSVLLLTALGAAIYFYIAYRQAIQAKPAESEAGQLVTRISRFMELPTGETPTLATVTDKAKLSGQDFFANAENGDKVLIYEKAAKAVLFRPSSGRVMNVAPINTSAETEKTTTEPVSQAVSEPSSENQLSAESATTDETVTTPAKTAPVGKAKVALFNGSTVIGVTSAVETKILGKFSDSVEVTEKQAAVKKDYQGTTVFDLSGNRTTEASALAEYLGGMVGTALPDGETSPTGTDILVLIGAAKK